MYACVDTPVNERLTFKDRRVARFVYLFIQNSTQCKAVRLTCPCVSAAARFSMWFEV